MGLNIFNIECLWILIAIAISCCIGYKKYIWFFSIGYGLAIATTGIILGGLYSSSITSIMGIACILFILYGVRLSVFLAVREFKNHSYQKKMGMEIKDGKGMNFFVKSVIWLSCTLLYFMMCAPVIYRFVNKAGTDTCFVVGMVIAFLGVWIEIVEDEKKSSLKKKNPDRFCDKGLYRIVRCPNYLGELLLWLGVFISGITALNGVGQWIVAIFGLVGIFYVMFSGAKRIEVRQDKSYGKMEEYQKYIQKTPIMIPLLPLYSVKKYKWLVA